MTAHSAGKVKVTATAGSGKKATCTITIGEPATKVEFSSLKSTSLAVGKSITLKAKASRDDKTKPVSTDVVYEIVDGEEYATIDAKGKLKGVSTGKVTVSGTAVVGINADFFTSACPSGMFANEGTVHKAFTGDGFSARKAVNVRPSTYSITMPGPTTVDSSNVKTFTTFGCWRPIESSYSRLSMA